MGILLLLLFFFFLTAPYLYRLGIPFPCVFAFLGLILNRHILLPDHGHIISLLTLFFLIYYEMLKFRFPIFFHYHRPAFFLTISHLILTFFLSAWLGYLFFRNENFLTWACLGMILVPSDHTQISPLLHHVKMPLRVRQILHLESSMSILVISLAFLLLAPIWHFKSVSESIFGPIFLGFLMGILLGILMKKFHQIKSFWPSFLALFFLFFTLGMRLESLLAAAAFGFILGTFYRNGIFGQLHGGKKACFLLYASFFFLIAGSLTPLGMCHLYYAAIFLFFISPISRFLALIRSGLHLKTRITLSFLSPRGLASLGFGILFLPEELYGVIYLICMISIFSYGILTPILMNWLNIKGKEEEAAVVEMFY